MFNLRMDKRLITQYAAKYLEDNANRPEEDQDQYIEKTLEQTASRGYLTKEEYLILYRWKSQRTLPLAKKTKKELVEEATRAAFAAKNEEVKIGVLMILPGVQMPVASTILHWVFPNRYPLLDFRALWTLGIDKPPTYNFAFWEKYVIACRSIAAEAKVSMRDLDRALWQFSAEHQNN